jgi:MFS family permease
MATIATHALSGSDHSIQLRKAVIASVIGSAIEWYDFFIYGIAAGLIFGKLYFPNEGPLTATLAAFGTYFIGFVGRPIGAAIFGHYGDLIGRRRFCGCRRWRPSTSLPRSSSLMPSTRLKCRGTSFWQPFSQLPVSRSSPSLCQATSPTASGAGRCT